MIQLKYTLGIDVGVGSLGMSLIERTTSEGGQTEHTRIIDGHSRVFPASTGSPEAARYERC